MIREIKLAFNRFIIKRKEPVVEPVAAPPRRPPKPGEPLAFCAKCASWVVMEWLPLVERGKHYEAWFRCADCGGRDLTFRYLAQ